MKQLIERTGLVEAAIASAVNDSLMKLKFIFTDFLPNANNSVVPEAEADNIIASALFMPIKMSVFASAKKHPNSIPIGIITALEKTPDSILAEAYLWTDEFPDIAEWILSNPNDVRFSWELWSDPELSQEVDAGGNKILKGIVTRAATIVDRPAYGDRTRLLAVSEEEDTRTLVNEINDLRAIIEKLVLQMAEDITDVVDAPAADDTSSEIDALMQELRELRVYRETVEVEKQRTLILASRKTALESNGIMFDADRFAAREGFIIGLDDAAFTMYVEDLADIARRAARTPEVAEIKTDATVVEGTTPEPAVSYRSNGKINIKDLALNLKNKNRN